MILIRYKYNNSKLDTLLLESSENISIGCKYSLKMFCSCRFIYLVSIKILTHPIIHRVQCDLDF